MEMQTTDMRRQTSEPPFKSIDRATMEEEKQRILEEVLLSLNKAENMRKLRDACTDGADINYQKALDWAYRVVEYDITAYGKNNDKTTVDQFALAQILLKCGNYLSAARLFRELHTHTDLPSGTSMRMSLAVQQGEADALLGLKRFRRSKEMMEQVLERRRTIFGYDDPDTLDSIYKLAVLLARIGKRVAAASMANQAYQGRKIVLGEDHPDTRASQRLLLKTEPPHGLSELERSFDEIYSACKDTLGTRHPETLLSLYEHSLVLFKQKRYLEAALEVETAHDLLSDIFGNGHPNELKAIRSEARCWFMVGDLHLFRCCMEILFLGWYIRHNDWELYYISRLEEWADRRKRLRKKRRENREKGKASA